MVGCLHLAVAPRQRLLPLLRQTCGAAACYSLFRSWLAHHHHDASRDLALVFRPPKYHGTKNIENFRKLLCLDPPYNTNYHKTCISRSSSYPHYHGLLHNSSVGNARGFRHSPKVLSSGSYSVLEAKGLQHWFKDWQESRKHKLTASTFGSAIGLWHDRRVQLWLEKLGVIKPFTGNLATCWSNIQEEVALERYRLITGNDILFPNFHVYNDGYPNDDWLAASPDGVVDQFAYDLPAGGVLEIKCPFFAGEVVKSEPWSRVPLYFMPQAQGLMEIMDRNWMDFYCWTPNGSSLFRVNRDQQYWKLLKIALSDFWWKHVHPAKEICRTTPIKDPIREMKSLRPAPRHELYRDIVYASRQLVNDSKLLVREIHGKLQD